MSGLLVVRCGRERLGLPVDDVLEVLPIEGLLLAPTVCPAVRGLLPAADRLVPLAHLRALLDARAVPEERGEAAVLIRQGARNVALEVDEAVDLLADVVVAAPAGWDVPWAMGVAHVGDALLPVVDLEVLVERMLAGRTESHDDR
jgi:purine-binding chemotaxis protein CheW